MTIEVMQSRGVPVARVRGEEPVLVDGQSALDLIATVQYEVDANRIALDRSAVSSDFFRLSTGLAGEILQKFVNYGARLAIIGDFSHVQSAPLRDFIYESNRGSVAFFVPTEEEALKRLSTAR